MASTTTSAGSSSLGPGMATALVVGNMIGSGVFLLPSALAAYGGVSILAWVFTSAGALLLALVFARLGRAYPETGGPYAYSRRAFGDVIGFLTAWGYWIAIWAGNAAIAVAFVSYSADFWPALEDNAMLAGVVGVGAIWLLTWVNVHGVRQGGVMQAVTTVLKLVPLVAIATLGLLFIDTANFAWNVSGESNLQALTAAAALTLWAFIGLESATVPADDVDDAARTIPRSTVIGTLVTAGVYILSTVAVMGVIPAATLAGSNAPFADAAREMFGSWAGTAVAAGAVISTFGCLNGWILLQGQVPRAAARDGLFPSEFARLSPNGTPVFGLIVSSILVTVLMGMNYTRGLVDQFTSIVLLATLTTLVPYAFSAAAQLLLLATDPAAFSGARLARDAVIAGLAFAYALWAIAGAGYEVVFKGFLLLLAGIPVYVWIRWRERGAPSPPALTGRPGAPTAVS